ncbi:unnamed protein product [Caenorhabditis auriculariae]|uniref:AD domain-containing protein n=1 Tax=Caenorhabditis auriculariae TaxID=2777116 RepID=A0A8S1H3H8_9PELO|nr:unnamed protein product [Caenorhabditis auriculariae]
MVSLGGESGAFPPGSVVQFKTVEELNVQGQVVCFDPTLKVLVIRDASATPGKPMMRIFNLSLISDIKEVSGPTSSDAIQNFLSSCSTNPKKAAERMVSAENGRRAELMPMNEVSLAGQRAFLQLRRTIADVRWQGANICVVGLVIVSEPFNEDSARVIHKVDNSELEQSRAQKALLQVKKILSKPFNLECHLPERLS